MSIPLQAGRTIDDLVDYILVAVENGRQGDALVGELAGEFGLSPDDAELAVDRVCGGTTRAMARNRQLPGSCKGSNRMGEFPACNCQTF